MRFRQGGLLGLVLAAMLGAAGPPLPAQAQASWVMRLTDKNISQLAMDPFNNNVVYAAGSDANQNPYVYKTTDAGNTWVPANKGLGQFTVYAMALATSNTGTLVIGGLNAVTKQGFVYRTDDGAQTWTQLNLGDATGKSVQALIFDPNSNQVILMGTDSGLYRTIDGGKTWSMVGASGVAGANIMALASEASSCAILGRNASPIYAGLNGEVVGLNGGVFRTEDDGNSGFVANNGLPPPKNAGVPNVATVYKLAASLTHCGRVYAAVDTSQPQLWWEPEDDFQRAAWQMLVTTDRIYGIAVNPITNNQAYAQVYYTSETGLYVSNDDGRHFAYASEAGTRGPIQIGTTMPQHIFVGGQGVAAFDLGAGTIPAKLPAGPSPAPSLATSTQPPAAVPPGTGQAVIFRETGHKVSGLWLDYFRSHGDVDLMGLPRTDVITDPISGQTVQYFQRAVLEFHPENPPPEQLQRRLLTDYVFPDPPDPPIDPSVSGAPQGVYSYFPNVQGKGLGHFVANQAPDGSPIYFKDFFDSHGREGFFGFPKEEPKIRTGADGQPRWTQRFQAAVMEYHPENDRDGTNPAGVSWRNYRVQLQLLGDMYIAKYNLGFK